MMVGLWILERILCNLVILKIVQYSESTVNVEQAKSLMMFV